MLLLIKHAFYELIWRKLFKIMHHWFWNLVRVFILFIALIGEKLFKNRIINMLMLLHCLGRDDKLNSDNRAVVDNFQVELAQQVGSLCNTVATSLSRQNEHLQCVENLCHSFMGIHDKVCKIIYRHSCSFVTFFHAFTNFVDSFSYFKTLRFLILLF
jgi:hypothetical protein